MAEYSSLNEFLKAHSKTEGVLTHTSMAGGSYFIGDDDLDQFYDLYFKAIRRNNKQFLTARRTDVSACCGDFDIAYDKTITKHLHTREQVLHFMKAYHNELKDLIQLPNEYDIYITEKDEPTYSKKKDKMKSGFHFQIPDVRTHKCTEQHIRRKLLPHMDTFFPGLPITDSWDAIYDAGVANRTVGWTVYLSQKPDTIDQNATPYRLAYIIRIKGDNAEIINDVPPDSIRLIKKLSVRFHDEDITSYTSVGEELYKNSIKSNGGGDITRRRGRPLQRNEKPESRASSPTARIMQQLEPEKKDYLRRHVMNLNTKRADEYAEWIKVAQCLYNIHPDLLDVFLDFSAQNAEKYNEADCIRTWNSLTFRNDGDRLSEGSLRYWSKEDNFDNYLAIEDENIDNLVKAACSLTEFDSAALIYACYRDNYRCSDFKYNIWYRWCGHVWRETDSGVDLLMRLSKEVAKKFFNKSVEIHRQMSLEDLTECANPVEKNKDCGKCDYCILESERQAYERVFKKLKTTAFKSNVMRECRELFFDEHFNKKINANKELLAFNNGVLELDTMVFRPGKPEDYISFSTGIDFNPNIPYYEYAAWPKVEMFLKQVLSDSEVREYFMKHLASNLVGGNPAQKFHVLTGSGSNGKSMLTNLMNTCMGEYACTVPISLLTQKRKASGQASPEMARLPGKRFVTMQEPDEAVSLNSGLMKEITSGEKTYVRDLFKSGGDTEILAKFHLACNQKPKINTTDGGTWRRLVVINFLSKFVVKPSAPNEYPLDESIQFAVLSQEWAVAFMAYMVHILRENQGIRKLAPPAKVLEYISEYQNENDAIAKFISERIASIEDGDEISPVDKIMLRRTFKQWKDENEERSLSPMDLEKRLEQRFGKYPRGGWTNLKIIDA